MAKFGEQEQTKRQQLILARMLKLRIELSLPVVILYGPYQGNITGQLLLMQKIPRGIGE